MFKFKRNGSNFRSVTFVPNSAMDNSMYTRYSHVLFDSKNIRTREYISVYSSYDIIRFDNNTFSGT